MTRHILVVEPDTKYPAEVRWRLECPDGNDCSGFEECDGRHEVDGRDATIGPWDCDLDAPWCDEEEFEFHGVVHTYHWGFGWTVPFKGCVVRYNVDEPPEDMELTVGRHEVDAVWEDEESVYLELVAPKCEHANLVGDELTLQFRCAECAEVPA